MVWQPQNPLHVKIYNKEPLLKEKKAAYQKALNGIVKKIHGLCTTLQ